MEPITAARIRAHMLKGERAEWLVALILEWMEQHERQHGTDYNNAYAEDFDPKAAQEHGA